MNKQVRNLKVGDILFRFLPEYQVWHTGMIVSINSFNVDKIWVLEFDDSDKITLSTLRRYMWFRKYFWVSKFESENALYPNAFRSIEDRIKVGFELFRQNNLKYSIHRYNCEYFVRRCVFKDESLWPSLQTESLSRNRLLLYAKLASIALFSATYKFQDDLEYEKSFKPKEWAYRVDDEGNIYYRNTF